MKGEKILITGAAGFIGFHLCRKLLGEGFSVIGIDNLNDYYDVGLKLDRLEELGINREGALEYNKGVDSQRFASFSFYRLDLQDKSALAGIFEKGKFGKVCNLAAQAGVRYSIQNPEAYINSNLVGFANLLECCRNYHTGHLVFASSSSVYGQNRKVPFSTEDNVDKPISLYAATKKSNELMAHTYSHLYGIKTTGLRLFTVYGPWGRPDMAMFLFTDAIFKGKPIKVFNGGNLKRDFTYIDDIVAGIFAVLCHESRTPDHSIYNIGNGRPVKVLDFIEAIEKQLEIKAEKEMMPMQPGDVDMTWADVSKLEQDYNYRSHTSIEEGIRNFVDWYKDYYSKIACKTDKIS